MNWSEISRRVCAEIANDNPGASIEELRQLLRGAYPFGERENFPYKAWLKAVRESLKMRARVRGEHLCSDVGCTRLATTERVEARGLCECRWPVCVKHTTETHQKEAVS